LLEHWIGEADREDSTDKAMSILATMVGALVLSRAVDSRRLSKHLLQAATNNVLTRSSATTVKKKIGSISMNRATELLGVTLQSTRLAEREIATCKLVAPLEGRSVDVCYGRAP
jgi:hypothetical protein